MSFVEGLQYLPEPIIQYILNKHHDRVPYPNVYHVTDLTGCLKQSYFRRVYSDLVSFDLGSKWYFFRGRLFDNVFSPLFEDNQKTLVVKDNGKLLTGTYDFIHNDVLYDLKTTNDFSLDKIKKSGKPRIYHVEQVQTYMEMLDDPRIQMGRILYLTLGSKPLQFNVMRNPEILDVMLARLHDLDYAVFHKNPRNLPMPREKWRCNPDYCEARTECLRRR